MLYAPGNTTDIAIIGPAESNVLVSRPGEPNLSILCLPRPGYE